MSTGGAATSTGGAGGVPSGGSTSTGGATGGTVSTGGTVLGLYEILEEAVARVGIDVPRVHGIFCAATEGEAGVRLPAPVHSLAKLPLPQAVMS